MENFSQIFFLLNICYLNVHFFIILGYIINYCPHAHQKDILKTGSMPNLLDLKK